MTTTARRISITLSSTIYCLMVMLLPLLALCCRSSNHVHGFASGSAVVRHGASSTTRATAVLCAATPVTSKHEEDSSVAAVAATTDDDATKTTLTLFSPCKINLFLRILRKRDDGFHDLASLFQAIGFGDTLELTKLSSSSSSLHDGDSDNIDDNNINADQFTCNMPGVPIDDTNLVLRALQLMRDKISSSSSDVGVCYFQANLIKQVPAQAGLGGGSANAATAMWAANELLGRPATLEQVS